MKLFIGLTVATLAFLSQVLSESCSITPMKGAVGAQTKDAFWKGVDGAESIVQITRSNERKFLNGTKTIVMYYTTRCTNSQRARKGYAAAAKEMSSEIEFGAVDCNAYAWGCVVKDHDFYFVPQFFIFKKAEWVAGLNYSQYKSYEKSAFVSFIDANAE